MFPVIKWVLWL